MIYLFWSNVKNHFQKEWKNTVKIKEVWTKTKASSSAVQTKLWVQESPFPEVPAWQLAAANWSIGKNPKTSMQERLKVIAAKKEYEKMRLIHRELHTYQEKALRKICQEVEAGRRTCLRNKREESCIEFGNSYDLSVTMWENAGIFSSTLMQIKEKSLCYYDVCF